MMITLRRLVIQEWLDRIFQAVPLIFSSIWCGQALSTIIITGNLYGVVYLLPFGVIGFRSLTVITITALYLFLFTICDYYRGPWRVVMPLCFISLGLQFNGIIWSALNFLFGSGIGGIRNVLLSIGLFSVLLPILSILHSKFQIVNIHKKLLVVMTAALIISIGLLLISGFFEAWKEYELYGLIEDPHNWAWGIEQFIAAWIWISIVDSRYLGEKKKCTIVILWL